MAFSKEITNLDLAKLLKSIAAAYQLKAKEKNRFRIVAYQRAAAAVEHLSSEAKDLWDEGKLEDIPGIGESIASHLDELFRTGKSKHFEEVKKGIPASVFELMSVPGVGPKTAFKLAKELGIEKSKDAVKKLDEAVKKGKVSGIEGFGEQSETDIQKSIKEVKGRTIRHLLPYASQIAEDVMAWLKKEKSVIQVDPLGSLRRKASTVGDIDISVSTKSPEKVLDHFSKYPKAKRIVEKGQRTATIILPGNIQVDLMVQQPDSYGSLLQHFTGSKHHNIALREYTQKKGLSLSEYGIKKNGKLEKFPTEKKLYSKLGLEYIPPELREDTGEIEKARDNKIPKLIETTDIKADLQIHSNFNIETSHDLGESSMEEIIAKADEIGYEYLAFTEHNPSKSRHSQGDIINLIQAKKKKIEQINSSLKGKNKSGVKKVFNSLEIDILPNGDIPVPNEAMDLLDFALVSIHSSFRQSRSATTSRVLKALSHPKAIIFAHPTARKLNHREGVALNWPEIFEFCQKNNKWLEINADPARLDLPDFLVQDALTNGVQLTLGTDAHSKEGLKNMPFGVSVARRGWATKKEIVNTRSLGEFEKMLA